MHGLCSVWHWSVALPEEKSAANDPIFVRKLLTEIGSILQSDFGDPAFTAEVVIRHVRCFKVGLDFAENFP